MMQATAPRIGVGEPAPLFALPSIQGATVDLAAYRGRLNVIVWLSRGFTCPFCLMYMDGIRAGYEQLLGTGTEVIQVAPNLLESARHFCAAEPAKKWRAGSSRLGATATTSGPAPNSGSEPARMRCMCSSQRGRE